MTTRSSLDSSLRVIGLLAVSMQLWLAGCGKSNNANSNDTGSPAPAAVAPAAALTEADATGVWKVVKIQDEKGDSKTGGIFNDFLSEKIDVRPDHTYGLTNTAVGHVSGTWVLKGNLLAFTLPGASAPNTTLTVEPPHLINRESPSLLITYDKAGSPTADKTPKFHLTAAELADEVHKNFAAAQSKYNNAFIEISGVVTSIDVMATGPRVMVAGPPPAGKSAADLFGGILCRPAKLQPWATVCPQQPVKVIGLATLMNDAVEVGEADFALEGPSLLINIAAADFAAEYKKDPDAAKTKYAGKTLIITGVVSQKQLNSGKPSTLVVGKDADTVYCEYSNSGGDTEKVLTPIETGQTIKLAGEFSAYAQEHGPQLGNCNLIGP